MVVIHNVVVRHSRLCVLHIVRLLIIQLYMDVFAILFVVARLVTVFVIKYVVVIEYVVVNIIVHVKMTML